MKNRSPAKHYRFLTLVSAAETEGLRRAYQHMVRIREQAIRRMLARDNRRLRLKALAPPKPKQIEPPPKKVGYREIVEFMAERGLRIQFEHRGKGLRPEEVKVAAFRAGVTMKTFRRVQTAIARMQLEALIASGSVTLPRIGRLKLVEQPERLRRVNVKGRIGKGGQIGWILAPDGLRAKFLPGANLRAAIKLAASLDALAYLPMKYRQPRRVVPPDLRDPHGREAVLRRAASQAKASQERGWSPSVTTAKPEE